MPCPDQPLGFVIVPAMALALTLGLAGCGGSGETVGEALGYNQSGPDEMNVIRRPPLTLPPDYNLRPPRPAELKDEANAASEAARETLIGPSSSLEPEATEATADRVSSPANAAEAGEIARATLTSQQQYHKSPPAEVGREQVASVVEETIGPSAGQTALISLTNRVERDIDALNETRAENRVDGALLRRLLAWEQPAGNPQAASAESSDQNEPGDIVKVIRRVQTPAVAGDSSE